MTWLDMLFSLLRRPSPAPKPPAPVPPPTVPVGGLPYAEAALLYRANAAREANGVSRLPTTPGATEAARFWSQYQARDDVMGHVGPPGYRDAGERLRHFGQAWSSYGECVAYGYPPTPGVPDYTPADAVRDWLDSPGEDPRGITHRKILLDPGWTHCGAGWAINPLSGRPYATVVFFR